MEKDARTGEALERIEDAYKKETQGFIARLRRAGRSIQEAEDIVQDAYAEILERLPLVHDIRNLPAWINSLLGRRLIDAWRREGTRKSAGETQVAEGTLEEIIAGVGLDPQDEAVRDALMDALDEALKALPPAQRAVMDGQVFGGLTFREMAERSGESIDTLMARKRYALANLTRALRHWIED